MNMTFRYQNDTFLTYVYFTSNTFFLNFFIKNGSEMHTLRNSYFVKTLKKLSASLPFIESQSQLYVAFSFLFKIISVDFLCFRCLRQLLVCL